jgi:hypothetical protein
VAIFSTAHALWFGMKCQTIKSKQEQTDAPHRCASGRPYSRLPFRAGRRVVPFFPSLLLVFLNKCRASRKHCRKCQEEPCNGRTELLGDDSRDGSNESTEKQTEPRNHAILFGPRAFIL